MEDKQAICNELCKVLQMTRDGEEIECIKYCFDDFGLEYVLICYRSDFLRSVNVHMDGGLTMIKDIM